MTEEQDSLELVRRAQAGELEAFDRLFERYYPRVLGMVRVRLGPDLRRSLESGDLVHDALIRAIRGFDDFELREPAGVAHWLSRIVENTVRMAGRREHAEKRDRGRERALEHVRASLSSGRIQLEPSASAPGPLSELGAREEAERLEQAMGSLSEEQREVLLLRNYAGASWELAARLLGRPSPDAARMLHARALLELRRLLGQADDDGARC